MNHQRPQRLTPRPGALVSALLSICILPMAGAQTEEDLDLQLARLRWQRGPAQAKLGLIAELAVPSGCRFAGGAEARKFLELLENPTDGSELGLLSADDFSWFVTFEFDEIGYVKDDEGEDLDADAMLAAITAGTEEGNKLRADRGWAPLKILGWEQVPRYDSATQNLVWAVRAESEGFPVVNYNTRRLGRKGVMNISLVVEPEQLAATLPAFSSVMESYRFRDGQRYDEFRVGDKVAEYGLTALITGGAAAVAVKSGLFKWLWKALVAGFIAIGAAFKAIFRRRSAA